MTVARSVKAAAVQWHAEEEEDCAVAAVTDGDGGGDSATPRRGLSWREAVAYSALALLAIVATLFSGDHDRYPFGGAWDGPCRPCERDGDGTPEACDLPAEPKVVFLILDEKGITDVKPGAFKSASITSRPSASATAASRRFARAFSTACRTRGPLASRTTASQ